MKGEVRLPADPQDYHCLTCRLKFVEFLELILGKTSDVRERDAIPVDRSIFTVIGS